MSDAVPVCRLIACKGSGQSWSFHLCNDTDAELTARVVQVVYNWGDSGNAEYPKRDPVTLAAGASASIWHDGGDGAELQMDLHLEVTLGDQAWRMQYEFPRLYRLKNLPGVPGFDQPGWAEHPDQCALIVHQAPPKPPPMPAKPAKLSQAQPTLLARNLEYTEAFYKKLGFAVHLFYEADTAAEGIATRDGIELTFSATRPNAIWRPNRSLAGEEDWDLRIRVDDVEAYADELRHRGVRLNREPGPTESGWVGLSVLDPDDRELFFGHPE